MSGFMKRPSAQPKEIECFQSQKRDTSGQNTSVQNGVDGIAAKADARDVGNEANSTNHEF